MQPDEQPIVHCNTVDVTDPKYADKLIVTDDAQNEVLVVADSLEEVEQATTHPDFVSRFKTKFGPHAEFVIHGGPSSKTR